METIDHTATEEEVSLKANEARSRISELYNQYNRVPRSMSWENVQELFTIWGINLRHGLKNGEEEVENWIHLMESFVHVVYLDFISRPREEATHERITWITSRRYIAPTLLDHPSVDAETGALELKERVRSQVARMTPAESIGFTRSYERSRLLGVGDEGLVGYHADQVYGILSIPSGVPGNVVQAFGKLQRAWRMWCADGKNAHQMNEDDVSEVTSAWRTFSRWVSDVKKGINIWSGSRKKVLVDWMRTNSQLIADLKVLNIYALKTAPIEELDAFDDGFERPQLTKREVSSILREVYIQYSTGSGLSVPTNFDRVRFEAAWEAYLYFYEGQIEWLNVERSPDYHNDFRDLHSKMTEKPGKSAVSMDTRRVYVKA